MFDPAWYNFVDKILRRNVMDNNLILNDIAYGDADRQKLDIFFPEKVKAGDGVILFIHGGGWVEGDKAVHHPDARYFCDLGYISATMNYRYVSESVNVFDELDDITLALKTLKNKCLGYGYNIEKLIISGGSAGAHLSLLYVYTRMNEAPVTPVAACVYCPPVNCAASDFLVGISGEFEDWKYDVLSKCCGCKITKSNFKNEEQQTALRKISPERYVTERSIPTAVFYGRCDELVPPNQVECFIELLCENGIENSFVVYKNSGHALDKDPEASAKAKDIISSYAEKYFI